LDLKFSFIFLFEGLPKIRRTNATIKPKLFWHNIEHRKKFLEEFAQDKGFDPYISSNWAAITTKELKDSKVSIHL